MKTYLRICIEDAFVEAENGDRQEIKRGGEYITSEEKDGLVIVFSSFWYSFPAKLFVGEKRFTYDLRPYAKKHLLSLLCRDEEMIISILDRSEKYLDSCRCAGSDGWRDICGIVRDIRALKESLKAVEIATSNYAKKVEVKEKSNE